MQSDIPALSRALDRGELTSVDLVGRCLVEYHAWEPRLRAFAWLDEESVRRAAAEADRGDRDPDRLLAGIPVAVKDIFDTAGVPTEHGSELFAGNVPGRDAAAVEALRAAGAILFGKTVTAELAYFRPGPTTNPWDARRTPGGSSMGSAAAVGAGVVPGAIGTQTNGSVIRPAAFCGVVGFKPTAGRLPTAGALAFSPALDQVGAFARDVRAASWLAAAMAGARPDAWSDDQGAAGAAPALAAVRSPEWDVAEPAARARFEADLAAIRAHGAPVRELTLPPPLADAISVHRTIMAVEGFRSLGGRVAEAPQKASRVLRELLEEGRSTPGDRYLRALREQRSLTALFGEWLEDFDALLTIPTLGEAPDLSTTGDPRCCTRWTLVGAPAITLPTGLGPSGLPLGLQLVGRRDQDERLVRAASWVEALLPGIGAPGLPHPVG